MEMTQACRANEATTSDLSQDGISQLNGSGTWMWEEGSEQGNLWNGSPTWNSPRSCFAQSPTEMYWLMQY